MGGSGTVLRFPIKVHRRARGTRPGFAIVCRDAVGPFTQVPATSKVDHGLIVVDAVWLRVIHPLIDRRIDPHPLRDVSGAFGPDTVATRSVVGLVAVAAREHVEMVIGVHIQMTGEKW